MVAVDEDGKPRPIPPLIVESEEERRDFRRAEIRREHRLALREAMTSSPYPSWWGISPRSAC